MKNKLFYLLCLLLAFVACKKTEATPNESEANAEEEWVENEDRDYIVKVGDMAPDFTLITMDHNEVNLASLRGKVVMLQFTASWCGVCRKEMPEIEKQIWQKHKDNPMFALYGVDREDDYETTELFIQKTGITYPMLRDTTATAFDLYAIHDAGITRNVIIDTDGHIVLLTRLYNEDEFQTMCQTIDSLLNK